MELEGMHRLVVVCGSKTETQERLYHTWEAAEDAATEFLRTVASSVMIEQYRDGVWKLIAKIYERS